MTCINSYKTHTHKPNWYPDHPAQTKLVPRSPRSSSHRVGTERPLRLQLTSRLSCLSCCHTKSSSTCCCHTSLHHTMSHAQINMSAFASTFARNTTRTSQATNASRALRSQMPTTWMMRNKMTGWCLTESMLKGFVKKMQTPLKLLQQDLYSSQHSFWHHCSCWARFLPALTEYTVKIFPGVHLPSIQPKASLSSGGNGAGELATPTATGKKMILARQIVGAPAKGVAPRELPRLAELVHGRCTALSRIIDMFLEGTSEGCPRASRAQVEKEIRSMATRMRTSGGKACWIVHPDMQEELGIRTPGSAQVKPADGSTAHVGAEIPLTTLAMQVQNNPMLPNLLAQCKDSGTSTPSTLNSTSVADGEDAVRRSLVVRSAQSMKMSLHQ